MRADYSSSSSLVALVCFMCMCVSVAADYQDMHM